MKLTKLLTAFLLFTTVAVVSCKSKSAKELIINKWKVTDISGKGVAEMPDSAKAKMYATARMEFMKDGKFETSDMGNGVKKGTYSISDDGKTLTSTDEGSSNPDILEIVEITKDKMVINDKKGDVKVTFNPK